MDFPIDYESGRIVGHTVPEERCTSVYNGYVIKLECEKDDVVVGFFNGFMYCEKPLIITSGQIDSWAGATKYFAVFYEGTEQQTRCELSLLHTGTSTGTRLTGDGISYEGHNPDMALFQILGYEPIRPQPPCATRATVGDTVFIVGFKGKSEPQLSFSEGVLAHADLLTFQVTACADNGYYPGSPVINADGFIIGLVQGPEGFTMNMVTVVPVALMHLSLVSSSLPGFPM
jgi:hypothetical protein